MITVPLLLLSICFIIYHNYAKKNKKFLELDKRLYFKEWYKSYPFIGIAYIFFGNNEDRMKAIQQSCEKINILGKGLASGWVGPSFYIITTDAEIADLVLKKHLDKHDAYKILKPIMGDGNICASVPIWRPRRRTLSPTFGPKNLNVFVHIFIRNSEILAEKLQHKSGKGPFKLWPFLANASMDNVLESVLGIQLNVQKNHEHPFVKDQGVAFDLGTRLLPAVVLLHEKLYKMLPLYKKIKQYSKRLHDFVYEVIDLKRKEVQNISSEDKRPTFLGDLMETSKYTELELTEEVLVLMLAGTDTTALATGFTMVLLSRHPHVQEKVYKELLEIYGDSNRQVEPEDLDRLSYLEAVIKETLRLYPPAPIFGRNITKDLHLQSGLTLVEGCKAVINVWGLHRNPLYWGADAEQFRPERFLDTPLKHPAQYIPFSWGARNCPGAQYAMLSLKVALATLLRQYRVLPPAKEDQHKPLRLSLEIMMRDVDGFVVALESRKNTERTSVSKTINYGF